MRSSQIYIADNLTSDSPLYSIFLIHLLETIVSKGDVHEKNNSQQGDAELAAREILELIPILARAVLLKTANNGIKNDEYVGRLQREAWFNIVVHGIIPGSKNGSGVSEDLKTLAMQSDPLVASERLEYESEIELNTVLRRGMNAPNTAEQKKRLIQLLPRCETEIRGLSYSRVIFLSAAYLVETSRAACGSCSNMLTYFIDPSLNGSAMEICMSAIVDEAMNVYLRKVLNSPLHKSTAPEVAVQLALMFSGCCHRISQVQQIAHSCADKIVNNIPSALCQKSSLFALLELLTLMWSSCLEAELDEYGTRANYVSQLGNVSIELSDDYNLRRSTLNALHRKAKAWVTVVINLAPLDVKGLLQVGSREARIILVTDFYLRLTFQSMTTKEPMDMCR